MTRRSGGGLGGLTARQRECTMAVTVPKSMRVAPGPRAVPVMVDGGGVGDDAPAGARVEVVP